MKDPGPLVCKTDKIDVWILAELSGRDVVLGMLLPDPVRGSRLIRWISSREPGHPHDARRVALLGTALKHLCLCRARTKYKEEHRAATPNKLSNGRRVHQHQAAGSHPHGLRLRLA